MANRRKRRRRSQERTDYPAWLWMLFGLSIGLAVAFAVYINDRELPPPQPRAASMEPAPQSNLDRNGEVVAAAGSDEEPPESRFDFYKMLPNYEVVIVEQEPDVAHDTVPQAIVEPGEYVLQAGSFSSYDDADRRRAQLALQGIESTIQRVAIDDRTYHRVRIGPTRDLDRLNLLRARLRTANIDVLRIRLGE